MWNWAEFTSSTKNSNTHRICCVEISHFVLIAKCACACVLLYSGKLSREKLLQISRFLLLFAKVFSAKFGPLVQQKRAIHKSFLHENCIFHWFAQVFSLKSFLLYNILVRFNNFTLTTDFYWSYTLLLKSPVPMCSWLWLLLCSHCSFVFKCKSQEIYWQSLKTVHPEITYM